MLNEFFDLNSGINLVYGEAATGKTTLALMLACDFSKFSKVIFIDTENGFNFERFKQISQEYYEKCLKNILLFKASNFDEQIKIVNNLDNIKNTNLIIIDTIGSHYRNELKDNVKETNDKFIEMFKALRLLNKKGINVFLNNQVYKNFNSNKIESVGGKTARNFSRIIIRLEKNPRKMIKEKPSEIEYLFDIGNDGIKII
ncbi:MAG: AAA family ATPase [Nanoarchaeota archaeon]